MLAKLDAAAANFHSTSADFEFDSTQTDPVPNKDVQKGTVYYERKKAPISGWRHTSSRKTANPSPKSTRSQKAYSASTRNSKPGDHLQERQDRRLSPAWLRRQRQRSFEQKWDITYGGEETLNGVKTEKLDLVSEGPRGAKESF